MIPPPHIPPRPQVRRQYVCYRAPGPAVVDGDAGKAFWASAPWTGEFVDIEGEGVGEGGRPPPRHSTQVKMLWDEACLYVLAVMEEPDLWATLTEHDSIVYYDNDFEVFLSPTGDNHRYYELEINALGTVFDLFLEKPYRDGGPADHGFDFNGLRKAVRLEGTLNDPRDRDRGWAVELAIPWASLDRHVGGGRGPRDGEDWRANFSRVQWDLEVVDGAYRKVEGRAEHNWVWSPQGVIDMHRPEMWGYLRFSEIVAGKGDAGAAVDHALAAKEALHRVYYAQKEYRARTGAWAGDLRELGIGGAEDGSEGVRGLGIVGETQMWVTAEGWVARQGVRGGDGGVEVWRIRQDSLLERE